MRLAKNERLAIKVYVENRASNESITFYMYFDEDVKTYYHFIPEEEMEGIRYLHFEIINKINDK